MKMPEPRTWAIFTPEGNARMWSMFQSHVQKLADAEGLTVTPLYTKQALIDLLEEAAKEAFDADHMGSVNLKLMKNRIGNAILKLKETL